MISRVLTAACAVVCAATVFAAPLPARADLSEASAINSGLMQPANAALESAMQTRDTIAQANPVGTPQAPIRKPGLPQGFTFNVDASVAFPTDNPGYNANDPGGIDAGFGYAFSRTNRLQVGYYEIQQTPIGFSNQNVPFYIQGFTGPGTTIGGPLTANTGFVDVTTKDKILTVVDQNLFVLGHGKTALPIIISPSYLSHWATIGGQADNVQPVTFGDGGPVYTGIHQRTEQEWLLPVTVPFLLTPRMFGTVTAAGQWLNHINGFNQTNHMQGFLLAYLEYHASKSTTFFVQPSRLVQYDPTDEYPQYTPTLIFGLSHHFTKYTYVQMTELTGGATNYPANGITSLTCYQLPNCAANSAPHIGGLKSSEVQLQLGIGSPTVIPL
jgi:hypothetical protein